MPNCFTLTRKSDLQAGPVTLTVIDEELCAHLGEPVHETNWCHGWYNTIGLMLAIGKSWDDCRDIFKDSEDTDMLRIIQFFEDNFTTDAWYQHGR